MHRHLEGGAAAVLLAVAPACGGTLQFVDVTAERGILPYGMAAGMGGGVVAADFDDDGDIDIFVPNGQGLPDQLYRNLGVGQFEEIAAAAGVASTASTRIALWIDYDGDHDLDLFTAGDCFQIPSPCEEVNTVHLYRQCAAGLFEDVTEEAGLGDDLVVSSFSHRAGACAGDLDGDGWLDLIFGLWDGEARVLRNNGDMETPGFTDISVSCGIGGNEEGHWQPALHDFTGDGLLDVFSAIDFAPNHLWVNQGDLTFVDVATAAGVDIAWNDMGVTLGDYDNDGDFDVYVTEIATPERHNALLRNDSVGGALAFQEVAVAAGVDDASFAWGATFLDADNDGWLDLAVTNGFFSNPSDPSRFFRSLGGDPVAFEDVSIEIGFHDEDWGSALIGFDYDRDGDVDLLQACAAGGPLRLLENQLAGPGSHNYVVVRPRMDGPNHRAIGAVVRITTGTLRQARLITAGTSHMGQEPAEAFFGVGESTTIDCMRIDFPDGTYVTASAVPAGETRTVSAIACSLDLDRDAVVGIGDLLQMLVAWGPGVCHQADATGDGDVDATDLLALLAAWGVCE